MQYQTKRANTWQDNAAGVPEPEAKVAPNQNEKTRY